MKHFSTLIVITALLSLSVVNEVQAQRWNRYRQEVGFSLGSSSMLGDLGGGPNQSSRFGDYQIGSSRFAVGGFYKYRFHDRFAVKANLIYGRVYASDTKTKNEGRASRNLDVRTDLVEASAQLEFYFLREKIGTGYKLKGIKGYGSSSISMYLLAGVGTSYFSPSGTNTAGDWVKLAPLNTEGQGLDGAPKDYSQLTLVFPVGFGIKYNLTKYIGVQFEAGLRYTTTDYLDDVSTQYYDGDLIESNFGAEAREMADKRTVAGGRDAVGEIRGNDERKDTYMFGLLSLTYRIKSKAKSRIRL